MSECPLCKNTINNTRGLRGEDGVDERGDPIPFWTDDPILTQQGLAGNDYKGKNPMRWVHIKELQNYYGELESDLGLDITEWLTVSKTEPCRHVHIEQLRIVVEAILTSVGKTIANYFEFDRLGNPVITTQEDWTDVDRPTSGANVDKPLIPTSAPLRAIHIEELRRGVLSIVLNALLMAFDNNLGQNVYANYSTTPTPFFVNADLTNAWRLKDMRYIEVHKLQHDKVGLFYGPFDSWLAKDDLTLSNAYSEHMTQTLNFMTIDYYYEFEGIHYYNYSHNNYWISTEPISTDVDEEEHDYVYYGASRDNGGNYVDKFICPWKKNIGASDGTASQSFATERIYPNLLPNVSWPISFPNTSMFVYVGGELWERVDSLSGQTADAKVCTVTANLVGRTGTATVIFGDGSEGAIPTDEASIVIEFGIGVSILWEHEAKVLDTITNSQYTKMFSVDGVRNSLFVNLNDPYYMNITANTDLDIYHDRMEITLRDQVKTGTFTNPNIYAREYGSPNDFDSAWGDKTITNGHSYRRQYWFDIYNSPFEESPRTSPTATMNPVIKSFNCRRIVGTPTEEHSNITITHLPYSISGTTVTFPYTTFFGITQADWLANYAYASEDYYNVYYEKGGGGGAGGITLAFSRRTYRYIHIWGNFLPGVTETIETLTGDTITYHGLDQMVSINTPFQAGESWDLNSGYYSTSSRACLPVTFTWLVVNMWWNDKLYKYNSIDDLTLLSFSDDCQGESGLFSAFKDGDSGFKLYLINNSDVSWDGHTKTADDKIHLYETVDGITWTSPSVNEGSVYTSVPADIGAYVPTLLISKNLTVI